MKILVVIHGYPPYYMAGSEVYTFNLCNELSKKHKVEVFSRYENPYEDHYTTLIDEVEGVTVTRVNKPSRDYTFKDKYLDPKIDELFDNKIKSFKPDIVYIGHLSHLSTSIPIISKQHGIPVVFTIHDFWMFCYRGQMITSQNTICPAVSSSSCLNCAKITYKEWIKNDEILNYKNHMESVIDSIDIFLAPSKTVYEFYRNNGVSDSKLIFSKYGFNTKIISFEKDIYKKDDKISFGFMGRVIPVKGMKVLFEAFTKVPDASLTIYGSQSDKKYLDLYAVSNVKYYGVYNNNEINKILSEIDVLIVPSIWLENSPLVIQEAFLAGIPVIASNFGGMAELVEHSVDGYLFEVDNAKELADIIKKIINDPTLLNDLKSAVHKVRTIEDDSESMINIFLKLIGSNEKYPWRITFDTNPGICNLKCDMCEIHSRYNQKQNRNLPVMDFDIIKDIIKEGTGLGLKEIIPSTMGEPLLYKHFEDLINVAKECNIKINLTTNGTFPGKDIKEWIEILLPICSDIKISQNEFNKTHDIMHGSDPNKTTKIIETFISGRDELRAAKKYSATITVQVTFMEKNLDEIKKMLEYYSRIGVDRIKGHHLWVTWPELQNQSLRRDDTAINKWNNWLKEISLLEIKSTKLVNFTPIKNIDELNSSTSICPFLGKEAWIAADGTFNICCIPDNLRKDFGDFGNVRKTPFIQLWNSDNYNNFKDNWGNYPHCNNCNMRIEIKDL